MNLSAIYKPKLAKPIRGVRAQEFYIDTGTLNVSNIAYSNWTVTGTVSIGSVSNNVVFSNDNPINVTINSRPRRLDITTEEGLTITIDRIVSIQERVIDEHSAQVQR